MTSLRLEDTVLWRETRALPTTLATTIDRLIDESELAALYGARDVTRIVATGNGAAYYVAVSLQIAAMTRPVPSLDVIAIPAGLLATGHFSFRPGDRLLAVSSSGEMGDVITALERERLVQFGAITATATSTIGTRSAARTLVEVATQDSPTHTQAYVGNTAAALSLWAHLSDDRALLNALSGLPALLDREITTASLQAEGDRVISRVPPAAIAFGSGPAWPAALEAALLLKEVAGVPAEGFETREGATSGMYALVSESLAISIGPAKRDRALVEAEQVCRDRGAVVVPLRAPVSDPRLVAITTFPAAVAYAGMLGLNRGLDIDHPSWLDAYYATARRDEPDA